MSTYRLANLLAPSAVAVIGGSDRPTSVGRAVLQNLTQGGFSGSIGLVNARHAILLGVNAVKAVGELDQAPDLAVLTTPAASIPGLIEDLGKRGCKAVVIISAGLGRGDGSYFEKARMAARSYGLRIVGPNCIGVLAPAIRLNASFTAHMPKAGDLALISQSGAIVSGVVEWASARGIGFSSIVSVGDQMDVDFGDLLDHFASDWNTRAILMYVESIKDARKFMSAARIAARSKPVVVLKSGRFEQGAKAAATHTGALAGSDAVYDAVFRRAGLLRVFDLEQLFDAAEILSAVPPFKGRNLAILTNGGGLGVLAVDRHVELGGLLASLSDDTLRRLDRVLPENWSRANPVDVIGDADAARYAAALLPLIEDRSNDGIIVMNVPTALASPVEIAKQVVSVTSEYRSKVSPSKPVLATWITEDPVVRRTFTDAKIPLFTSESAAVQAFTQLVRYSQAQEALRATPPAFASSFSPRRDKAETVLRQVLDAGQEWLRPEQMTELLSAYEIPVVESHIAATPSAAASVAAGMFARCESVAIKILSPDIVHKSDVGGVRLGLKTTEDVERAAREMLSRIAKIRPEARLQGVLIQEMVDLPNSRELIIGVADDPSFGRVIAFGQGGVSVEVVGDKAIGLPPLDLNLAASLIDQTRIARLLKPYRNVPAANRNDIEVMLVKVSQLVSDFPEIVELDFNPVLAGPDNVIALDSRILVRKARSSKIGSHLAIRPYPNEWEQTVDYGNGEEAFVRPMRPEDELLMEQFFAQVTEQDLRLRFFNVVRRPGHAFLARLTQIDYARAMAFAALDEKGNLLGVVRLHADANYESGEYAILLRSDLKGKGLGWKLMELIIRYARAEGLKTIVGEVLSENTTMLAMCEKLGFDISSSPDGVDIKTVRLHLINERAV